MPRRKKIVLAIVAGALGLVLLAGLAVAGVLWFYARDLADLDESALRNYRPPQVTRILARDGTVIGELFSERRTVIDYGRIPSHVENAFLAAEDADFYRHEGLDWLGIVRAAVANLRAGAVRQGASTITQQVVKIFLLSRERTFERKLHELILARRLERSLTKREILELYLNEIYLGHGCYGIEEASRFYFGKSVSDIDLGQAAILAGLPKAPSRDSPIDNPEGAKKRQVYVLRQMVRRGWAEPREAERFIEAPLDVVDRAQRPRVARGAEEFVDVARAELEARYGADALDTLGATVRTSVDLDLQRAARAGLQQALRDLDRRQRYGHGNRPASAKAQARARKKGAGPLAVGAVRPVVVAPRAGVTLPAHGFPGHVGEHPVFVEVAPGSRYDEPDRTVDEQFPPGAITMARIVALPGSAPTRGLPSGWALARVGSGPEGVVVVVDAASGEVLAMVGGYEHRVGDFNRAVAARRQPGSSFKPFVYGAALASRKFTAASIVEDSPEIYEKWRPTNFRVDVYRGPIRLREALTHSVNTVAIKLLDAVGFDAVEAFARAAGIESELAHNLSLALGTSEVTPYELARAYTTLARGGSRLSLIPVLEIQVPGADPVRFEPAPEQTLDDGVVYILTSMMRSVVEAGTGRKARSLGRPVAGKTGTSADNRDAWFAGFTPRHVAVAWIGFDTPRGLGRGETGGRAALPAWLTAMQAAEAGVPARDFVPPPSVEVRVIDPKSGLLVPPEGWDGPTLEEVFLPGTAPVEEAAPEVLAADDALLDLYGGSEPPFKNGFCGDGGDHRSHIACGRRAGRSVMGAVGGQSPPDGCGPDCRVSLPSRATWECTSSLRKMDLRWLRTVCGEMCKAAATSPTRRPEAILRRTSRSRGDRAAYSSSGRRRRMSVSSLGGGGAGVGAPAGAVGSGSAPGFDSALCMDCSHWLHAAASSWARRTARRARPFSTALAARSRSCSRSRGLIM